MPRTETLILLVGLACTVWGKLMMLRQQDTPSILIDLMKVMLPDVLFVASVFLLISCLYLLKPSVFAARGALLIAALVSTWAVLNAAWLITSGVQLQPGVLLVLARDPWNLWPLVQTHIVANLDKAISLGAIIFGLGAYFLWRFRRPVKVVALRAHHTRRAVAIATAIAVLFVAQSKVRSDPRLGFATELLGFSSHWYALASTVAGTYEDQDPAVQNVDIPRIGQRQIGLPKCPTKDLPNVVLVLLESISHSATSLGNAKLDTMPHLTRLAAEGVEFRTTRVPVTHTTKAFWTTLTASTPIIRADYIEAVPIDQPYEGLPSILARVGYRSAFFEMSKGSFECAPGFFSNLAFDQAWFRENLQDASAYLGYLGGDDCRMIDPALEWAANESRPFFLMMITSVAHDPYQLPEWFDQPNQSEKTPYEKYLQTVRYTDYFIGQLCKALKDRRLDENTILCILGDHGAGFRGKAGKGRWIPYEELIRVPWVIRWPGHIKGGQTIDWPSSQLDVTPTILKLIGFDIKDAGFEGKDAFTPSPPDRRIYFASWYANSPRGFVEGTRKIVYWPYLDKVVEYDLSADPGEKNNPKTIGPDEAEQFKRDILIWQNKGQMAIKAKRFTEQVLFSHWQTFSVGQSAWAYYVP